MKTGIKTTRGTATPDLNSAGETVGQLRVDVHTMPSGNLTCSYYFRPVGQLKWTLRGQG